VFLLQNCWKVTITKRPELGDNIKTYLRQLIFILVTCKLLHRLSIIFISFIQKAKYYLAYLKIF
jgi:hypothetical protein